ncbi:MAG: molybdopterin oxidoreductase [Blastopirellula sp.]|nr:MAG: molybdopterin oxidoreductase [Blastopirellula sp.]
MTAVDPISKLLAQEEIPVPHESIHQGSFLLDMLLEQQQDLTAVERFSNLHESGDIPDQAQYYRKLMPANPPGPGQQYAFDVDLDSCSGCKACVTACHTLNGLDEDETWRDVGMMCGGTSQQPAMQHVTTACHHCVEPACMIACPVDAYVKDEVTGIVKHLDDQCIGCKYCTLACPYEVPKYNHKKGIVRKCDMCTTRLSNDEAPACVQACPHEAIRIQIIDIDQVSEDAEASPFLPATPDPQITLPTTTYRTKKIFPRNFLPADYFNVSPQSPHWPLVIMLVLTQLSVGGFVAGLSLEFALPVELWEIMRPFHATGALLFGLLALSSSVFHLGRPLYAFRAVLGLRHSWLSREILAFGIFAKLAIVYALCVHFLGSTEYVWIEVLNILAWMVSATGLIALFCSAMIYIFTRKEFWSPVQTGVKFTLTTAVLGVASVWLSLLVLSTVQSSESIDALLSQAGPVCGKLLIIFSVLKLGWEASLFTHLLSRQMTSLKRSAMLMTRQLSSFTMARFAAGLLGGIMMPAFLLQNPSTAGEPITVQFFISVVILVIACIVGELLERYLFFAAVASPRMPGGIR